MGLQGGGYVLPKQRRHLMGWSCKGTELPLQLLGHIMQGQAAAFNTGLAGPLSWSGWLAVKPFLLQWSGCCITEDLVLMAFNADNMSCP